MKHRPTGRPWWTTLARLLVAAWLLAAAHVCYAGAEQSLVLDDDYRRVCAANSFYVSMRLLGKEASYAEAKTHFDRDRVVGVALGDLKAYFLQHGVKALTCSLTMKEAAKSQHPFVMLTAGSTYMREKGEIGHYVVCTPLTADRVLVIDAPNEPYEVAGKDGGVKHPCIMLEQGTLFLVVTLLRNPSFLLCFVGGVLLAFLLWKMPSWRGRSKFSW